jgi:hypothetical protein
VLCLSFLLLSGLQIFNAHPELYWGQYGADGDSAFIKIGANEINGEPHGLVTIGSVFVSTTSWNLSGFGGPQYSI